MKKDLTYYLNLPYKIELEKIPPHEGGGYSARIPLFGQSITGDGETREEALQDLDNSKEKRLKEYLEKGLPIPEPETEEAEDLSSYSGKYMIRMSRVLHRNLVLSAQKNGVSLNLYINNLLSVNWAVDSLRSEIEGIIKYNTNTLTQSPQNYAKKPQILSRPDEPISDEYASDDYPKAA